MNRSSRAAGARVRLFFWLVFIASASYVPFSSLYYNEILGRGDGSAIGLVTLLLVLQPLLSLFSSPLAGYLADRFKIKDRMLLFCSLGAAAGGILVGLPGFGLLPGLSLGAKLSLMGVGIVIIGLASGPVFPIINAEALDLMHARREGEGSYGRYRLHGSLSWIVFTLLLGALLSLTRWLPLVAVFFVAGYLLLALTAAAGAAAGVKPVRLPWEYLRRDRFFRRFIVFNMLQSASLFSSLIFTGYFFNDAHIDFLFIGLAFAVGAVLEIPIMLKARAVTAQLGNRVLVAGGTGLLALKVLLLGLAVPLNRPWLIIPIMAVHGAGFGLQVLGVMNTLDGLAHRDLRALYLNLYTTIGVNLPMALGIVLSGWIIRVLSSTAMMLIDAGLAVVAIAYFLVFVRKPRRRDGGGP